MARSYLRKIILEEIRKVLKEQMTPRFPMSMREPAPRDVDFSDDPAMIVAKKPNKKVAELQRQLNKNLPTQMKIKVDGILGPQTKEAIKNVAGTQGSKGESDKEIMQNIDSYITAAMSHARKDVNDYISAETSKPREPSEEWRKPFSTDIEKKEAPAKPVDIESPLEEQILRLLKKSL